MSLIKAQGTINQNAMRKLEELEDLYFFNCSINDENNEEKPHCAWVVFRGQEMIVTVWELSNMYNSFTKNKSRQFYKFFPLFCPLKAHVKSSLQSSDGLWGPWENIIHKRNIIQKGDRFISTLVKNLL